MIRTLSFPIIGEERLESLAAIPRLLGRPVGRSRIRLVRETCFDTPDFTLGDHAMTLRSKIDAGGTRVLVLGTGAAISLQGIVEEEVMETPVEDGGVYATLGGDSEVAARVRAVVDPAALRPYLALDIDRESRDVRRGLFGKPTHRLVFHHVVAHTPEGGSDTFQELSVQELDPGRGDLEGVAERLRLSYGLESDGLSLYERVRRAMGGAETGPGRGPAQEVRVALVLLREGEVALAQGPDGLTPPLASGSGEDAALEVLGELGFEGEPGDLDFVGFVPTRRSGTDLEVWLLEGAPGGAGDGELLWMPLMEVMERVGGPGLRAPELEAALLLLVRSEVGLRLLREAPRRSSVPRLVPERAREEGAAPGDDPEDFLDLELSILEFNQRVLELAEDPSVPLLERWKFLSIFSSNLDEFFVVRVGRLKEEHALGRARGGGGLGPSELLDLIQIRVRALVTRQYQCLERDLLPGLAERGVRVRGWRDLDPDERRALTRDFERNVFPLLTPLSLSTSAGRPFPRLVSLGLSLAAVLDEPDGGPRFGCVSIPPELPRHFSLPGSTDLVPTEEVIAANVPMLFPGGQVRDVHVFRVSRIGDVEIDEDGSGSLLEAVADEVEARAFKPVVRLEVQRSMPRDVQAYLLRELRAERGTDVFELGRGDVYEVDGPIDLRTFGDLPSLEIEDARYEPFAPRRPIPEKGSVFDRLAESDLLVHHPFDDFETTVGRLLAEAAEDPDVVSIKLTLYRTGRDSPVMRALLAALENGKDVSVFVELKARFDEESNIEWTHRLVDSGAHVVYGLVGFKTHAKTALVVRREASGLRRYVHIGTGNYNATTARFYTDLGLMSADPDLGADLHDFFNELTGSAGPPRKRYRRLLVAPATLAPELLRMIEREAEHARKGRPARIRAKLNGLADREVVRALYEASDAGVPVELVVRSICTLRPGVPGLSERVSVRSLLGRFLEHSRIYHFRNGGEDEYYIGSADWRARNLRRRVEVVTPVDDERARATLGAVLDAELSDPRAWVLRPDGAFERLSGEGPTAQERMLRGAHGGGGDSR